MSQKFLADTCRLIAGLRIEPDRPEEKIAATLKALLDNGGTATQELLSLAAKSHNAASVRLLLRRGLTPSVDASADRFNLSEAPLIRALETEAELSLYLGRRATPEGKLDDERALRTAGVLLEAGADPDYGNPLSGCPLHNAADRGRPDVVRLLLESKADPDRGRPESGLWFDGDMARQAKSPAFHVYHYRPLHSAAMRDSPENAECARLLLAAGADASAKDRLGRTPLDIARQKENNLVAKALGGRGAPSPP